MIDASEELTAMIAAATAAGQGLLRRFGQLSGITVRSKSGPADLVSIADEEAEQTVRTLLAAARPDYGFQGEEGGVTDALRQLALDGEVQIGDVLLVRW